MSLVYLSETEKIMLKGLNLDQYEPGMFSDLSSEELSVSSRRLKEFGFINAHYGEGHELVAARILDEGIIYLKENQDLENPVNEDDFKRLQKSELEYKLTIRDQQDRIRNLEEQIKTIELLKGYWWVLLICLGIGTYIGTLLDKWIP